MKVRYTPRAFADREAIFTYLDRRNPRAARDVKAYIKKRILDLGNLSRRSPLIPRTRCPRSVAWTLSVYRLLPGQPGRSLHHSHQARRSAALVRRLTFGLGETRHSA